MTKDLALPHPAQLAPAEPRSLLEAVIAQVSNPDVDPARLREFLEIGIQLKAIDAKEQFTRAMAEMRPELPTIKKNGLIVRPPSERSKGSTSPFAKWDDVHRACMPILDRHGFSCTFASELEGANALKVTMTVHHIGGHEETGSLVVPWLDTGGTKSPAQAAASSFSVAQRHAFIKYFNILTEDQDDDGTGNGVPDRITEQQAMRIADICDACEEKQPGHTARFKRWLKTNYHVDGYSELFQGEQLAAVMEALQKQMTKLGVK